MEYNKGDNKKKVRRYNREIGVYLGYRCYLKLRKKQKQKSSALSVKTKSSPHIKPRFSIRAVGSMDVTIVLRYLLVRLPVKTFSRKTTNSISNFFKKGALHHLPRSGYRSCMRTCRKQEIKQPFQYHLLHPCDASEFLP